MRILIVEDDERDQVLIRNALLRCGRSVDTVLAATAAEGLAQIDDRPFDAVLLDCRLRDIDGCSVLHQVGRQQPVLMLSEREDDVLAQRCLNAGAQDFLITHEIQPQRLWRAIAHARHRLHLQSELQRRYEAARALAEHDALTGLSNRLAFDASLRTAMQFARRHGSPLALFLLDIDNFKAVNDTYGHNAGDALLKEVARRLFGALRAGDLLCRLGGDEFAVLGLHFESDSQSFLLAQRLITMLQEPIRLDVVDVDCTASIGVACYPSSARSPEELMKQADLAMYKTKRSGGNGISFFSEELNAHAVRRVRIEHELRIGLQKGQFELHYQPELGAFSNLVIAGESLLRWRHPAHGLLTPGAFLDVAEDTGLIVPIGEWVLCETCRQARKWIDDADPTVPPPRASVNLSGAQLRNDDIVHQFESALSAVSVDPEQIELEVTESAIAAAPANAIRTIEHLSALGARVTLADFGSEHGSLSHLRSLPLRVLKINRSLAQTARNEPRDSWFLESLLALGRSLELETVVEGIETEQDAWLARSYRADRLQGFYFAPGLPAEEFQALWLPRRVQALDPVEPLHPGQTRS